MLSSRSQRESLVEPGLKPIFFRIYTPHTCKCILWPTSPPGLPRLEGENSYVNHDYPGESQNIASSQRLSGPSAAQGFPVAPVVENPPASGGAGRPKRCGLGPWMEKLRGGGRGSPLQSSCPQKSVARAA